MAKLNYHHARREKERVRKARQQEKLLRRTGQDPASATKSPQIDAPATMPESGQPTTPMQPESGK